MKKYIKIQDNNQRFDLLFTNSDGSGKLIPCEGDEYKIVLREVNDGLAEIIDYTPPLPTWEQIRSQRNVLLTESDWITLADSNPKPSKEAWLAYRQALRDIPQNFSTPESVVWPAKPE